MPAFRSIFLLSCMTNRRKVLLRTADKVTGKVFLQPVYCDFIAKIIDHDICIEIARKKERESFCKMRKKCGTVYCFFGNMLNGIFRTNTNVLEMQKMSVRKKLFSGFLLTLQKAIIYNDSKFIMVFSP